MTAAAEIKQLPEVLREWKLDKRGLIGKTTKGLG